MIIKKLEISETKAIDAEKGMFEAFTNSMGVIDKDGDVMISGLQSISKYAVDSNNKRQWEWISKQITLGEDNKSKKYYKVETHSNTDEEFIQYSIDKGDFIQGSNISKKAKSLQIKIDSEDPNLEVDSISIPYRNLPNSKQNI